MRPSACRTWLEAWDDGLRLLDKAGIESIEAFDERFRGTSSRGVEWAASGNVTIPAPAH